MTNARRTMYGRAEDVFLAEWYELGENDVVYPISNEATANIILGRLAQDPRNLLPLRLVVSEKRPGIDLTRVSDRQIVERACQLVARREIHLVRRTRAIEVLPEGEPEKKESGTEVIREKTAWIRFRVVDDFTGDPISGVEVRVLSTDGIEDGHKTNTDGVVELKGIPNGTCSITSKLREATLNQTLDFRGFGEIERLSEGDQELPKLKGPLQIARITRHKVRTGESLDGLAQKAGMTWQDLAKFNWGTDAPAEINKRLRLEMGCTKQTASGDNYIFDDEDEPGIIYIPRVWSSSGHETERTHTIRVRRVEKQSAIRLDDAFSGFFEKRAVRVKYADGFEQTRTTDQQGLIPVQLDHWSEKGNFADITPEDESEAMRVFLVMEHASSRNGAWQRLVNLGCVEDELEAGTEPEHDSEFAAALEEFQGEEGIRPTGELDDRTVAKLRCWQTSSEPWGENERPEVDDPEDADYGPNPKEEVA